MKKECKQRIFNYSGSIKAASYAGPCIGNLGPICLKYSFYSPYQNTKWDATLFSPLFFFIKICTQNCKPVQHFLDNSLKSKNKMKFL